MASRSNADSAWQLHALREEFNPSHLPMSSRCDVGYKHSSFLLSTVVVLALPEGPRRTGSAKVGVITLGRMG